MNNKKQYLQPATTIVTVAIKQMVCTSGPNASGSTNKESDLLSREALPHYNIWDDEEE